LPDLITLPFFLAAALLLLGGLAKIRRPAVASRALAAARLPSRWWAVRGLGLVEMVAGTWALLAPATPPALAVAVLYGAFAVFLTSLIARRVPAASCGCVGASEAPPSLLHVALDLIAAASALLVATSTIPSVGAYLGAQPLFGVPLAVGMATAGYAAYAAIAFLPALRREVRRSSALGHRHDHRHHAHTAPALLQLEHPA
jgi:hypothetical protein